ncbi:MAG: hypothetical protein RR543_01890 [Erysipelotrichales bacterium]
MKKLHQIIKEINTKGYSCYIDKEVIDKYGINSKHHSYKNSELIELSKIVKCVLVIGLIASDPLTKIVEQIMLWNTIFVVPSQFGYYSDASNLINDGAYCLCTIYDFNRCLC